MNHETNEQSCRGRTSQNERDGTDGTDGRGVLPPSLARNRTLTKCASFSGASSMSMTSASAKSHVHLLSTMSKDPPVLKPRICRGSGGRGGAGALKIVAALVLTLLAMEIGVVLAYLAHPAAGAMTSLSKALDAFTGENGQKPITLPALRVGVDPSVLELAGGLMGSLGGGAPGIGGEAKAAGVAVGKTGFALWCESAACLGDDLRLLRCVGRFGIQQGVPDPNAAEPPRQELRVAHGGRPHQHGLPPVVPLRHLPHHPLPFGAVGGVDQTGSICPDASPVGRNGHNPKLVSLPKLLGLRGGRARHPRELAVHLEEALVRD